MQSVVPLAGTWIEIISVYGAKVYRASYLSQVRGLKFQENNTLLFHRVVPLAGTWIEIYLIVHIWTYKLSYLSQVRGLKYKWFMKARSSASTVVPLAGTWIEIQVYKYFHYYRSRTSRRYVD